MHIVSSFISTHSEGNKKKDAKSILSFLVAGAGLELATSGL